MRYKIVESGNALFLILIAVALFAALSYAITQSGSGGGSVDREQEMLAAAQIIQYVGAIEQTITRLRLVNGCSDTEISFENSTVSGYVNPNAPIDKSCHIFDPAGGGMRYVKPNNLWLDKSESASRNFGDYWFTGTNRYRGVGTDAGNDTQPNARELVVYLNWLTKPICMAINRALNYPMTTGEPPLASGTRWDGAWQKWVGVYGPEYSYNVIPNGVSPGYLSGCWLGENTPRGG